MARHIDIARRRDLAAKATSILQEEGFNLSMSRLAEALDIKRPTLLYYFPKKSHIVESALEQLLTEQATFVISRIAGHEHPIDRLYEQLRSIHAFHHGRGERILFLAQAIGLNSRERMKEFIDVGNRVFELHRQDAIHRIELGIEVGTVLPCDAHALVATIRALSDGLVVQHVMTGCPLQPIHEFIWKQILLPLKKEETQ